MVAQFAGKLPPDQAKAVTDISPNLPPSVSDDGRVAYATITFDKTLPDLLEQYPLDPKEPAARLRQPLLQPGEGAGFHIHGRRDRQRRRRGGQHLQRAGLVVGQPRRPGRPRPRRHPAAHRLRLAVRDGHPHRHGAVRGGDRRRARLLPRIAHDGVVRGAAGDDDDRHRRGPRLLAVDRHPPPPVHRRRPRAPRRLRPGARLGRQGRPVRRAHRLHRPARAVAACPSLSCRPSAWPPPSASRS